MMNTLLDLNTLSAYLNKPQKIALFDSLPSTNDYLKSSTDDATVSFCLAEQQTKGRGRFERPWHSPAGQNIYLSCLYTFDVSVDKLEGLSLVVGLAIIETLQAFSLPALLKWPNDVLVYDKKISGTLIEIKNTTQLVIGIGLNANMITSDLQNEWTSLQLLLGHAVDRNKLAAQLINNLMLYLEKFFQQGFAVFLKEYLQVDYLRDKQIILKQADKDFAGSYAGINTKGELALQLSAGEIHYFASGETTLKKS